MTELKFKLGTSWIMQVCVITDPGMYMVLGVKGSMAESHGDR